jgi:hypothetical protein
MHYVVNGSVTVSPSHLVWVVGTGLITASEVRPGDTMRHGNGGRVTIEHIDMVRDKVINPLTFGGYVLAGSEQGEGALLVSTVTTKAGKVRTVP